MPIRHHFELHETIATILADTPDDISAACRGLETARHAVERYILKDPFFKTSFEPVSVDSDNPVICHMAAAAQKTGVGPMAAVAGAVANYALCTIRDLGCRFCIIDNGGDIAILSDRAVKIGLYAGDSSLSKKYAFVIQPTEGIYGVCTSSATVGHSISLGTADSVTIFGPDPVLDDAVATAVCNQLSVDDQTCLDLIPEGIDGVFAVFGDQSIIWGSLPQIIPVKVDENLITAGERL